MDLDLVNKLVNTAEQKHGYLLDLQEYPSGWQAKFWNKNRDTVVGSFPGYFANAAYAIYFAFNSISGSNEYDCK